MKLNIKNETSRLKAVVLGLPKSPGPVPELSETYDAKSYESVIKDIYPTEESIINEMQAFCKVLRKYGVEVLRPTNIENCNQVFARDVAFVIDDKIISSNIIPDREAEKKAYQVVYDNIEYDKILNLPEKVHVEGGDIVLYDDKVFVGQYSEDDYPEFKTARTNTYALDFLREFFPSKEFIPIELHKHDTNPRKGILHLDCTFMPVGKGKAILYEDGLRNRSDIGLVEEIFGKENVFRINTEEMYYMNSNIFSIAPDVVVSEKNFTRLNRHMREEWSMTVEEIPYREISKMGGLLRCSTMPLIRE